MKIKRKTWVWIIIIAVIIVGAVVKLTFFRSATVSFGCKFMVTIAGDPMEPTLKSGSIVFANKCFEEKDLKKDVIVVYKRNNGLAIGRIYSVEEDELHIRTDKYPGPDKERVISPTEVSGIIDR